MIPEAGQFVLALACALALGQVIVPVWGLLWGMMGQELGRRGAFTAMQATRALAKGQMLAVLAAIACLAVSAARDDFSVLAIAAHSASTLPWTYKLAGLWGYHEGALLLWCLALAGCGAGVARARRLPLRLQAYVLIVLGACGSGFLLFCLLASNPLARLWPPPMEGQGLQAVLQDPGMVVHPPVLYAGYVGFAVPFAFALAGLMDGNLDARWARWVRPWVLGAWSLLTGGIALGSWWAYYELGWGGYWFWDPVENAALLPWLTGTALLHSVIVLEKRGTLPLWTAFLAIITFALSLLGTFLVRSGLLNSVHSFTEDPARGLFLLVLLVMMVGGALALFALRAPHLPPGVDARFALLSREGALVVNNLLLCSMATVVLVGTLYPAFADLLGDERISVGPPFFQATLIPLALAVLGLMGLGPLMAWRRVVWAPLARQAWQAGVMALVVGAGVIWNVALLPGLGFGLAVWLIGASVIPPLISPLISPGRRGGVPARANWGMVLAHAGMGMTIAGIAGMSVAQHQVVALAVGGQTRMAGYEWVLRDVFDQASASAQDRVAEVQVQRAGREVAVLHPLRRVLRHPARMVTKTAIHTDGLRDFYAVLGEERQGAVVLRLHYNPLAPWIWLGALVMMLGGGVALWDRTLRQREGRMRT